MKILLLGNFPGDGQESMRRFTEMLHSGLTRRGHGVTILVPIARVARLAGCYRYSGLPKYFGYFDKFVLFPARVRRQLATVATDVVHIVDHANAAYAAACTDSNVLGTCHDLLQVRAARGEIPQQRPGFPGRRFQAWILSHIARLPRVACVSHKTAEDLLRLTGLSPKHVSVIPNALNYPYAPMSKDNAWQRVREWWRHESVQIAASAGGFLLHVGGDQWYKNRPGLLTIFAHIRRRLNPPPILVMVGKPLSVSDAALAQSLGIADSIFSCSNVSNEDLQALYCTAEGLIFPSWQEGFGWPIAEAQACGCPVFTSSRAPMNDVGGESALYFDPAEPEDAAARILAGWSARSKRVQVGLNEAKRWAVDLMLNHYEHLYTEVASQNRP